MGPRSLSALHRLQEVETHLRSLKDRLRRKQRQLHQHQLRIKQAAEALAGKKEDIKHQQSRIGQEELEFKARDASVNKLRSQLNAAKSNKEYSAILTQLNTERADNSKLEERILEELSAVDETKKALSDLDGQIQAEESQHEQREKEFEAERQELQDQIGDLEQRRAGVAGDVPPENLSMFQRVADRHDGQAMARIIKLTAADEYVCEGCNMSIPMEIANALLTRNDIQQCHVCGRILFLEDEVKSTT